jgi:DNA-binding transcriptional ArsR family regulator
MPSNSFAILPPSNSNPIWLEYLTSTSSRYRIRALHHLAGGNYRMYVLLSEFLTKDQLDDLVSSFETLADALTPYFQERMRSLPDQQRQILQWLCDAEGARTVKEIAEETFISERNCSKQLGNLKSKGYVRSERRGKESYYDVAEPLMRLCLDIKSQRGRPLKLVARFLKAWFPEETLKALANHDVAEPTLAIYSLEQAVERLRRAFEEGQKNLASYGGAPFDLVALILERGPSEWARYASAIAAIYIQYNAAAKLGQGITKSIELLDQADFSPSQLDQWYRAWQQASDGCEDLQLPLECVAAAVDVLKSDTPDDRPLFRLPLEIRQLVQPLLRKTLASE